ncbi:MAG TPA: SMI1/KNR4 family protein [Polyangiaceae bacterium]|nr:SMI1/KNR4 family protein [Polyangiaceae bacterium]
MDYADLARRIDAAGLERRPRLTEVRARTFEQKHHVKLPTGYRRFLLEVGDGVACEGFAFCGLEEAESQLGGALADPFPYGNAYAKHILTRLLDSTENTFSDVTGDPSIRAKQVGGMPAGCLVLGDLGGGEMSVLVVSGEQAGLVWRVGDFDAPETIDLYTPEGDGKQLDFDAWLECWALQNGL